MKAKTLALVGFILIGFALALMGGCQSQYASSDRMMNTNRIEWQQGLTGFPQPKILYP